MRLPAPMDEETLGKIMLTLFALAAFGVVVLFLTTKSAPPSVLGHDYIQHSIAVGQ